MMEGKSYCSSRDPIQAASIAIVACQHLLLWTTLYVMGVTVYVVLATSATGITFAASTLLLTAGLISLVAIALHNAAAYFLQKTYTMSEGGKAHNLQRIAGYAMRLGLLAWLVACAMTITFIVAKHPGCLVNNASGASAINVGVQCLLQRSSVVASLSAFITSCVFFVLVQTAQEPYRCHLFGIIKDHSLLPSMLPYKNAYAPPAFSDLSFKCRSSTPTLFYASDPYFNDSATTLRPHSAHSVGLGIFTSKTAGPSYLSPRPSLTSIRSQTTMSAPPYSSPLPPLPAYLPREDFRRGSALHKAIHPPKTLSRASSDKSVRIVPPSPALSMANLRALNKSTESLSSVYSRSISGEEHSAESRKQTSHQSSGRSCSSTSSGTTVKKSRLAAMRLASQPEVVITPDEQQQSRMFSGDYSADIDDAATLQVRLTALKTVSVNEAAESDSQSSADGESGRSDGRESGVHGRGFPRRGSSLSPRKQRGNASPFH